MARTNESTNADPPALPDQKGWRHWGDGLAGRIHAARIQGFYPTAADYRDIQVDVNGVVQTSSSGSGGGAATIADGADVAQGTTTDLSSANTVVGILKAIKAAITGTLSVTGPVTDTQLRASAVPVSLASAPTTAVTGPVTDTQLRASAVPVSLATAPTTPVTGPVTDTQLRASAVPVSLATNTPDVTDRAARLLGVVDKGKVWDGTNIAAVKAGVVAVAADNPLVVTVHPSSAPTVTQPVSLATNTPDVTDRAARLVGRVRLTDDTNLGTIKAASAIVAATDTGLVTAQSPQRADAGVLCVTNTGAAAAAVTASLPIPGAGLFHYITFVQIVGFASALRTAAAAPVLVTTTNLPGSPVFSFQANAMAQGASEVQVVQPATPIKSSVANTATTVVGPATTAVIWRITVWYYTAP